jgi:hypothetical protein
MNLEKEMAVGEVVESDRREIRSFASYLRGEKHEVLIDILGLVDVPVSWKVVSGWSEKEQMEAEKWAVKTFKASDNPVRVPSVPLCVATFLEEKK